MFHCSLMFGTAQLVAEQGKPKAASTDYRACVAEKKIEVKENLRSALNGVKAPAAKEALKSFHVAFITAIDGIVPGMDERKFAYDTRQQTLSDKMNETWARFEVEI